VRKTFVQAVIALMEKHNNIVLLLGDIGVHGFREAFQRFPDRTFNIGIMEQSMVSVAAGWALKGYRPIVHTIAPFLVERAYEQLKIDFGYHSLPGIFVGAGGSYDYSSLGCTHHCPADVSLLENIPGFTIFTPGNSSELEDAINRAFTRRCLSYIRLSERANTTTNQLGIKCLNALERPSTGPTVVSVGPCLDMVRVATMGLDVCHVYANVIPGEQFKMPWVPKGPVVVVEPWYRSSISQQIMDNEWPNAAQVINFCVPKSFIRSYGKINDIDQKIGFTADRLRVIVSNLCTTQNLPV
jgi:transketolase